MIEIREMNGDEEDRTPDLSIANAALSHLSYVPECRKKLAEPAKIAMG